MMLLGNWEHWLNRVQEYIYPSDSKPEYSSILVPNVDNVRTSFLMETIAKQNKVRALFESITARKLSTDAVFFKPMAAS